MDPRLERRRRLEQAECLLSFYAFVKRAWSIVQSDPLLEDARGPAYDHIRTICLHLQAAVEGRLRRMIINVPPGHGKSALTSVLLPAWLWARDASKRMMFASYDEDLVTRDADLTRELVNSDWYQRTFVRGKWSIRRNRNKTTLFATTRRGFRQCMTVGGGNTGHRGDMLVIDDPIKATDALSPEARDKVIKWYGLAMSSRFVRPSKAVIVLIMQRLHDDDLAGHLIRRGGFTLLKLQSIKESEVYNTPEQIEAKTPIFEDPRADGELLCPAINSEADIEDARKDMADGFAGQHQQNPVDLLANMFPRSAWRFWKYEDDPDRSGNRPRGCDKGPAVVLPRRLDREILTVDCGFKKKTDSDRTAMHHWGAAAARRFLLDRDTRQRSYPEARDDFGKFAKDHPRYDFALVEQKANGVALEDDMREVVPRLNPEDYNDLVYPQDSKVVRALAWSPALKAGNVYLYEGADYLEEFIAEHERFPKGVHDDDVDAASLGMNALREAGIEASAALAGLESRLVGARR